MGVPVSGACSGGVGCSGKGSDGHLQRNGETTMFSGCVIPYVSPYWPIRPRTVSRSTITLTCMHRSGKSSALVGFGTLERGALGGLLGGSFRPFKPVKAHLRAK